MHDVNIALSYADKIMLLKDGKIFAFGGVEILDGKTLKEVYGIEAEIVRYNGRMLVVPEV